MKVKDLIAQLSEMNPDDNVCSLIITKEEFDYSEDDEVVLTREAWDKVVADYETGWTEYHGLYESIGIAVAEIAEPREDLE